MSRTAATSVLRSSTGWTKRPAVRGGHRQASGQVSTFLEWAE
ncbi:hypothetical protein ACIRNI_05410 [Streptomyces sp. NPDC093546]